MIYRQFNALFSLRQAESQMPPYANYNEYYNQAASTPGDFLTSPRVAPSPYGGSAAPAPTAAPANSYSTTYHHSAYSTSSNVVAGSGGGGPVIGGPNQTSDMAQSTSYAMHGMQGPQGYSGQVGYSGFPYNSGPNGASYSQLIGHPYGGAQGLDLHGKSCCCYFLFRFKAALHIPGFAVFEESYASPFSSSAPAADLLPTLLSLSAFSSRSSTFRRRVSYSDGKMKGRPSYKCFRKS